MLSVKELRTLGASLNVDAFCKQLGPFVLIQRPPGEQLPFNDATALARPEDISLAAMTLIFEFENLLVATLPPLQGVDELAAGRLPDCDLVIDDPSVSKRHATLHWHADSQRCSIKDLDSTNGTFLNGTRLSQRELQIRDGDVISFGESQFWYLLTETLHHKLHNVSGTYKLGSRSG